jgi:hypothetical protein
MKNKSKIYKRNCPSCENEIEYKTQYSLKRSEKSNTRCRSCVVASRIIKDSTREKLRINGIGRTTSSETRAKMSVSQKLAVIRERKKNPNYLRGVNNSMYGKPKSLATKLKISISKKGWKHSEESKLKISRKMTNRKTTNEFKKKMRIIAIDRIENAKLNGNQLSPNYNISTIPILEQKAKELGIIDLQHAENGGEYHIKELGYWVDGYSKEKNIVIEYYEKFHLRRTKRDLQRQKEITDLLKCEFIIIKE